MAAQTTKLINIEHIVGSLVARVTSLETNAASGSSGPDSARSWNMLGQSNGSTPTKSPGSLGHPMTKGIQDVDLILLQALKTNMHGVPSHYDSHVNNSTLELRIGSTTFGKIKHSSL